MESCIASVPERGKAGLREFRVMSPVATTGSDI